MMKTRRGFSPSSVQRLRHSVYCVVFLRDSLNGRCHHEAPLDTRMPVAVPRARFVSMLRPARCRPSGRGRDGDGRSLSRRRVRLARYLPCFRAGWREVSDFGFWNGDFGWVLSNIVISVEKAAAVPIVVAFSVSRSASEKQSKILNFFVSRLRLVSKSKTGGPHWPPAAYMFYTL